MGKRKMVKDGAGVVRIIFGIVFHLLFLQSLVVNNKPLKSVDAR
jgi:hypothetical protein